MDKRPWYSRLLNLKEDPKPDTEVDPAPADAETRVINVQRAPTGVSGTEKFGGVFTEDYFRTLQGSEKANQYDKMRRGDARVKMCLSSVKNPLRSAQWGWTPGENDENGQKHADFLNFIFCEDIGPANGQMKKFKDLLNEAFTVVDFGMSCFERSHKVGLSHPKFGQYVGLSSLGWRNPKTLEYFHTDEFGNLESIEQHAYGDISGNKFVKMPAKFLNIITMEKEGDNYEGISLLRPCYGAWSRKQVFLKLLAIGVERLALPTPKAKIPAGREQSPDYERMVDLLEKLTSHQMNYITFPDGWEVEYLVSQFDPEKVTKVIQFENEEMTFAFLANFLTLGSGGNGGAYALGSSLQDFFTKSIQHVADLVSECFQEVGKELIILNFGPQEKYPKLVAEGLIDEISKEFGDLLKTLVDGKMLTPDDALEEQLRKRLKIVPMREEDKGKRDAAPILDPNAPPITDPNDPNYDPTKDPGHEDYVPPDPNAPPGKKDPNADPAADPEADPEDPPKDKKKKPLDKQPAKEKEKKPKELSAWEVRIQLAESKAQATIGDAQARVRAVLQSNAKSSGKALAEEIMKSYRGLSESQKIDAINGLKAPGSQKFYQEIKAELTSIATEAIEGARKEVPKAKKAKLSEFDSLPSGVKKRVLSQSRLMVTTTLNDLEKVVFLQYGDSVVSTDSESIIESDILGAGETYSESASIVAAGGNTAARIVNESRSAFFFDEAVLEEVETFTFVNGDPVSDICQSLAGKTFAKDDPEADRLFPPLHHNCKSYIVPNLVGNKDNPPLSPGGLKTKYTPGL